MEMGVWCTTVRGLPSGNVVYVTCNLHAAYNVLPCMLGQGETVEMAEQST